MANPTTYFGWVMPTATDLVTDLPADFNVFGQGVDTSMQDLLGGTTGQVLSKTSNTNMDFTWINNDQGDITAVTAGVGITGGGTSGAVTVTNDMATTITTAGDLIKGTGSGTYNRLGIGSTSQVLTVVAGAPAWATPASGSMTSLATGSLTGATPSISSISGSYKHLQLWVTDPYGSGANIINMRFNSDTGSNYTRQKINGNATPTVASESATSITSGNGILTTSNGNGYFVIYLPFYSTTASAKHFDWYFTRAGSSDANEYIYGTYNSTSAISSIQFFLDGGQTFTGGDYTLYGVN
tara:strand:+ start:376 stop:1266 length:891 start_codon:yes stop_codon:yes gene_type:complete